MKQRNLLFLSIIVIFLLISGCTSKEEKTINLNYEEKITNGIKTIYNSAEPSVTEINYNFKTTCVISAENENDSILLFKSIERIKIDSKKNIYVLDLKGFQVVKFDSRGNHIKSFGNQGTGPGEFLDPYDMEIRNDTLYVADNGLKKVLRFDIDGKFINDIIPPKGMPQFLSAVPNGNYMGMLFGGKQVDNDYIMNFRLTLMDNKFNPIKEFSNVEIKYDPSNFSSIDLITHSVINETDEIFIGKLSEDFYKIDVYDYDGNHKYVIKKTFRKIKFNDEELLRIRKNTREYFQNQVDVNINKMLYKKAIGDLSYDRKNGYLLVKSAIERTDENKRDYIVDIFKDGKFIKKETIFETDEERIVKDFVGDYFITSDRNNLIIKVYEY